MTDGTRSRAGTALEHPLTPFVDPLPRPVRRRIDKAGRPTVRIAVAEHRFHSEMPPSTVWTYDGELPGPMIDVDRGAPLEVLWQNHLEGTLPVTVVRAPVFATDDGAPRMLTLRELVEDPTSAAPAVTVIELDGDGERTMRWRTVATRFEDRTTFLPVLGRPEVWRFINLTVDTHPIHVHLDALEFLARHPAVIDVDDEATNARDTVATVRIGQPPDDGVVHAIDDNERGFKDTVRVNPNEVVDIAVRFDSYAGRYMYHCHILEHEDRDMMRPFVVTPPEVMPFMDMHA